MTKQEAKDFLYKTGMHDKDGKLKPEFSAEVEANIAFAKRTTPRFVTVNTDKLHNAIKRLDVIGPNCACDDYMERLIAEL